MTIEYLPVGIACNLKCEYCYQDEMRLAGNINEKRDWPKAKSVLLSLGSDFSVFGGEPLLAPIEHLREVWAFGFEMFGKNGIQTNAVLLSRAHVELFKEYNVGVGISVDGPGPLNSLRASLEDTQKTQDAIRILCKEGLTPSLIVTLHAGNARTQAQRTMLKAWFLYLEDLGIRHINLHILESEKCHDGRNVLHEKENIEAFSDLYEFSKKGILHFQPFDDIRALLTEPHPNTMCVWNHCDPLTTAAVQGVGPDGSRSNCGRTNKDGVNWIKGDKPGMERYHALYLTPQEHGGCRGCRFFVFCKGQCPGTAIDGDWRNRTEHCQVWYHMFELVEKDVASPISLDPLELRRKLNALLTPSNQPHLDSPHVDWHADSNPSSRGVPGVLIEKPSK